MGIDRPSPRPGPGPSIPVNHDITSRHNGHTPGTVPCARCYSTNKLPSKQVSQLTAKDVVGGLNRCPVPLCPSTTLSCAGVAGAAAAARSSLKGDGCMGGSSSRRRHHLACCHLPKLVGRGVDYDVSQRGAASQRRAV